MIYLDYASHTNIDTSIFSKLIELSNTYPLNVNSLYQNNFNGYEKYTEYETKIKKLTNLENYDFVLTSSATESNNLALKGYSDIYKLFGKHIISTPYEHSSISGSLNTLKENGFEIEYVEIDNNGFIDLNSLTKLIRKDTILVSISSVNSESGHIQNINAISNIIHNNPNTALHIDATQSFGKIPLDYSVADLISCSAHKFYGPTSGCGGLFIKNNLSLKPQIDGGKAITQYRSSTPDLLMIAAFYYAAKNMFDNIYKNFTYVKNLHSILKDYFLQAKCLINSDCNNPYILNVSTNLPGQEIQKTLAELDIFISTKSSCSAKNALPKTVMSIYNDKNRAKNSIRISLSHKTTLNEIEIFINEIGKLING